MDLHQINKSYFEDRKLNMKVVENINISLPRSIVDLIVALAEEQGVTIDQTIVDTVLTKAFILKEVNAGSEILVRKAGSNKLEKLVFLGDK